MSSVVCFTSEKGFQSFYTLHENTLPLVVPKITSDRTMQQPVITIWVHGTKNTAQVLAIKPVRRFFDCLPGLHHKDELSTDFHLRTLADTITQADPHNFNPDHFYIFGWSGKLCFKARRQAAEDLYADLVMLLDDYRSKMGKEPTLRIITHSHGGNVALLLAEIMDERQKEFFIDELILLACPVQDYTAHLTQHEAFKKIYSIYSSGDLFQVGDPQGAYAENKDTATSFFSRRHFTPFPTIRHVMVTYNGRPSTHVEFILIRFAKLLPFALHAIDTWYTSIAKSIKTPYTCDLMLNIKK